MQYSQKHNVVIYQTDVPERILHCIPEARASGHIVVVPCTIQAMQIMRKLGYPALSPILTNYDWPIKAPLKPFDHQRQMAAFHVLHPRSFNLSDMGTGKTLSVLWALDYLMLTGVVKRALIVAPLSTIYRVWENECFTHLMSRRSTCIIYGSREKRLNLLTTNKDCYIINHDGLGIGSEKALRGMDLGELAAFIQGCKDIDAVIVDEGSIYKRSGTDKYKVLRKVLHDKPYVWWLTGTPTPNAPTDAWAQAKIVRLDYSESYVGFRERTMTRVTQFKWVPKPDCSKAVAEILQPAIRFSRDECLDLPPVTIETRDAAMSDSQKKAYEELRKQLKSQVGEGTITAINEAVLRQKLIQVSAGAVYGENHEAHKIDAADRIKVLREVIEEAGGKVLVFSSLTSVVNLLYNELSKDYAVAKVTGEINVKERSRIFQDFQDSDSPSVIVADPRTMAHGLTLTAASTTIWYSPTDQAEIYQQANKRMDRPGQTRKMVIVRITSTPIEREIYKRLDSKQTMQGLVLNILEGG